jgi:hypothetical protein
MPYRDPTRQREAKAKWDRLNRPHRGESHTTRAGFALRRNRFVTLDGEGYNVDKSHHVYAYLGASDGKQVESIYNPEGLSPRDVWQFLLSLPKIFGPAIYVGFSLGYDIEFWLPTHPERLKWLDRTGRCRYGPFRFLYWPRKRFEVARTEGVKARVRVDDLFSYYGKSFEVAVEEWKLPISPEEARLLREGKAKRGKFTREDFESGFIRRYNGLELRLLGQLVRLLRESRERVGIYTSDFYSPANLAVALFKKYHVRIRPSPPEVERAAYAAFFGGRIECAAFGTYLGPVYEYDINRAYPHAMSFLPDLSNGSWDDSADYRPDAQWSLYHLRWAFPQGWRFYPFPWRASNLAVFYPPRGSGWIWAPEIDPQWVKRGWVNVTQAWHFRPAENNVPPFGWQADVYQQTLDYKARGETGPATTLKLGQNSCYGKLAQQTSAKIELINGQRVRARPTFHQPCYAGLITSITRARLWKLLAEFVDFGPGQHERQEVVALCTDAVYSLRPLVWLEFPSDPPSEDRSPVSSEFGSLKMEVFDGMQSLQSGVNRTLRNGAWESRGRGFTDRKVPWDLVNKGWRAGKSSVRYEVERFVGHRWAHAQSKWPARSWSMIPKVIHLGAVGKRYLAPAPHYSPSENPATRLYWTNPERDVEYTEESNANLPDFNRRPQPPPEGTAEDLADLGWAGEPSEETDVSATRRSLVQTPAGRIARRVA